jgi:WD40 repeat protein
MAPEQAAGRHRELVPATDVFALGVIFYELLTGRPPFQGESVLETLKQVSDREPPPPRVLRPGLPRDLDTICRKCLEKRPDRRYASGAELADDLGRFLAGRPVKARPVPAWVRAGKWVRRWPALAALVAVLALGLLGVLGGLAWSGARERRYSADLLHALDRVRESERRARAQTRLATERERLTRLHWTASQTRLAQSFHDQGDVEVAREVLDGLRPEPGRDDLRGFAWHYLDRLCRSRFESSEKLSGQALSAGLSADGRTFAVGSTDGRVSLWDLQTRGIRTLAGKQRGEVRAVRYSPDGRTLASASHSATGGNVTLWDVASGEEWVGIPHDFHGVYGLVFSPDGSTLTTVDVGGPVPVAPVRVWALAPDRRRASLVASLDRDQLRAALPSVYRPPGADTAAGDEPPNAGPRRERASPPRFAPQGIAIGPDGRTMAVDCGDGAFGLFHTSSAAWLALCRIVNGELFLVPVTQERGPFGPGRGPYSETDLDRLGDQARKLTGCARARLLCTDIPVHTARLARDGRTLAVDTNNGEDILRGILRLFDTGSGRAKNTYTMGDVTGASDWSFTPDGRSLIIAGGNQVRSTWGEKARVWHFEVRPEPPSPRGHAAEVWALAYSPDGRTLASSSDDHTGKLWDLATGRERMTLRGHESLVTSIAYAPDGTLLASGSFDHTIRLWDAVSGRELAVLRGHTDKIRCIAISPDGRTLASGGDDRTVRLWDVATRRERSAPLTDHTSLVRSVVFTPDGKSLISGALDKTIRLWDWGAGRACSVRTSGDQILALALSPDGKTLASAGPQGDVVLWDREGMPRRRMRGHTLDALGLAFSPDGHTLASAGRDKTVRLWDPTTGQEQLTLKGHDNCVHAAAFSPDGSTLASGCHDGAIKLWRSRATPGQE